MMNELYKDAVKAAEEHRGTILSLFCINSLSPYEMTMVRTIRYIIMMKQAVSLVENAEL